ncbi:SpoIIIAH-like family protein [Paenibacillus radicis (ex Xue et al. 2023)]|uniref:SpoIIIAH-like family protein n=1 Tax=Paenibacillus radicis (ex Xue et al. 2023) TaxID=2972489 RepID=A0ABT1YL93_9BACL|nr:SpoIIIAH-like family protein [Paenibacillus radicis (ex Xue et al. 2023)]MCR8633952.1 SpoIIIAH-like family protein [Paenibacillus radicis (ex Xue et al. 2023)]
MNSKRQTIWLVSMLSLMVVLSAYYLFTEDVNNLQFGSNQTTKSTGTVSTTSPSAKEIVVNTNDLNVNPTPSGAQTDKKASAATTPEAKQPTATPVKPEQKESSIKTETNKDTQSNASQTGGKTAAAADTKAAQPTAKTDTQVSAADAKVLQQVMTQAKSGTDYFTSIGLKRNEDLAKQTEKWLTIISDPKQTAEAAANAEAELRKIQDNEAKVTSLEETLMKEFPQAVITEESSKWKITVQSNKLEKSQAVSIIEKVMNEMNVGAEKIVVQYVP